MADICKLMDTGYQGQFWTYEKKVAGGSYTQVSLDRALASAEWNEKFPATHLIHLTAATSDHCPILLNFHAAGVSHYKRSFKYEVMWETHDTWRDTLQQSWASGGLAERLDDLRRKLKSVPADLGS